MKRFFFIGDSIRQGYCATTRELLGEEAEVCYPEENCRFTQYTYVSLPEWAKRGGNPEQIDLVYWNNGHWDCAHWMKQEDDALNSPQEYGRMLGRVYKRIRQCFPRAKVVFATTTTREEGAEMLHPRSNQEIRLYNEEARRVMAQLQVPVSDMAAFSETLGEGRFADGIHFTPECFEKIGEFVAQEIKRFLRDE